MNDALSRSLSEFTDDDHHTTSNRPRIEPFSKPDNKPSVVYSVDGDDDDDDDDRTDTASEQMNIDDDSSLHTPLSTDVAAATDDALVPRDLRTPLRTRYGKIPRLLKHDLRRFYPKMLVNVLNSQDHQLVHDFFHKFFVPEASLEMLQDLSSVWQGGDGSPPRSIISGRNNMIQYCYTVFRSFPDVTMTLQTVDIQRSNYDRHSQVHLKYTLQWTHLVPTVVNDVEEASFSSTVEELDASVASGGGGGAMAASLAAHHHPTSSPSSPVVQLKPRQRIVWEKYAYEVFAGQVLHLNEEWYITHVDSMTLSTTMRKLS